MSSRSRADVWRRRINAVLNGEERFWIEYQPIRRLSDRDVVGYESLSRFDLVPGLDPAEQGPDVWFKRALECDLGIELEALAVTCALRAVPLVCPKYVSVNVSVETLLVPEFARMVMASLPQNIVVELTENDAVMSYKPLRAVLAELRGEGSPKAAIRADQLARLAIDDVGAGHSGLTRVVELRPDILKLDRALIADVDSTPIKGALVAGMVIFAASAGMVLVAEGVETEAEAHALEHLGVDYGQGWLLGRPARMEGVGPCLGPL